MRIIIAVLLSVLLIGLNLIPIERSRIQQQDEPHHGITDSTAEIPKINFIEQVRDMRRKMENHSSIHVMHHNSRDKSHAVKQEIVVRFAPSPDDTTLKRLLAAMDGKIKRRSGNVMIIKSKSKSTEEMMRIAAEHPDSVYAEPNYLLLPNRIPNDPFYQRYQWNLPMIGMERGWEISRGSNQVIVAVVDTGVDLRHPDFRNQLVTGYNVLNGSNRPFDDNGHGTHVAGIIAARTNNQNGIAGMNWNSKLMAVKAIGADGSGTAFDIAEGIRWAVDHGARVINLSVGNYTPSAALREACKYAYSKNVILVAASGNDNTDQPSYPAAYPEVLSVAAVDHQKHRAEFSNFGPYVDVAAPGVDIASTYIYSDYAALSGTSMACPHVVGLAALLVSKAPNLNNKDVMNIIQSTATDLGPPGKDSYFGYGLINARAALEKAAQMVKNSEKKQEKAPPAKRSRSPLEELFSRFFR